MAQAKNTTILLKQLRGLMQNVKYVQEPLGAYIVPSSDSHNSEYLAECDERRAYISGFTGSAGTAIITHDKACMWTDGRYFIQASEEMDTNWTLMKEGILTTPTQGTWLCKTLPSGSSIGVDPSLFSFSRWAPLQSQLESAGLKLVPVTTNLVDQVWADKPAIPNNPVKPLELKFSGKSILDKLTDIRVQMKEKNAQLLVLTALDEIAWVLNLRGSDIPFNPVFFAYVLITSESCVLFIDPAKYTKEVEQHIESELGGLKAFNVQAYDKISDAIKGFVHKLDGHAWLSETASYALTGIVPQKSLLTDMTPVALMKAIKNPVEIQGMRNAHIKDGVALCCYFSWLQNHVAKEKITEISGADKLNEFRKMQENYMGPSFDTISSVGAHGAIIHYKPSKSTDVTITVDAIYLCDSGGQYKDGTTDVTRTFHFGAPSDFERECYTRVLKGQIQLGKSVFPNKMVGNRLDSFARRFLWDVGLDYAHGTGHGIGAYLNVHEGPIEVSWRKTKDDPGLEAGMFISNEPGYYEDGKFGIRLEDIVQVVTASTPHNFNNRGFLTFETVTLCPIQTKMIKVEMLTRDEINHLNGYHEKCREIIGPLLEQQAHLEAKDWLWKETQPIGL